MMTLSSVNNTTEFPRKPTLAPKVQPNMLKIILALTTALSVGAFSVYFFLYLPVDNQLQNDHAQLLAQFEKMKQEVTFLRESYSDLMHKQTTSPEAVMDRLNALEHKTSQTSPATTTSAQAEQLFALITLKEISSKIENGLSFVDDVSHLEKQKLSPDINLDELKESASKKFATLLQLNAHLQLFDSFLVQDDDSKGLITQMGDFLKITKSESPKGQDELRKVIDEARNDIAARDVHHAYQVLSDAFDTEDEQLAPWFVEAESYLEGEKLRQQIAVWTGILVGDTAQDDAA